MRVALASFGVAIGGFALASCERVRCEDEASANGCSDGIEVCDPVKRTVCPSECKYPSDCPSGTICAADQQEGASSCQVPGRRSARQALISGFQVAQFPLERVSGGTAAAFSWQPPDDARIVHCALFACRPDVRRTGCEGPNPTFSIVNYEQCVIARQIFEPASGLFDLGDSDHDRTVDAPNGCSRRVTELLVGCWAYDESRVIAATRLESVLPSEIYDYGAQFNPACGEDSDDKACVLDANQRLIGTCSGGVCRKPCVQNTDCADDEPLDAGVEAGTNDAGAAETGWNCEKATGEYVGVCIETVEP